MNYNLCIACDHCDPSRTNDRQQVRCTRFSMYVDGFNGCDDFQNKAQDEYFEKLRALL